MSENTQTIENQELTFEQIKSNIANIHDANANAFTFALQLMKSLSAQTITSDEYSCLSEMLKTKCEQHGVQTENEIASLFGDPKPKVDEYTEMLMNTPVCRGLELVESSISNSGIQVCKEKHEFPKHDVLIVRGQWTKTSGAWSIRVNNYYATKRHFLQIPMDTLTQCRAIIQQLKETGECQLWTGHFISIKNK